MKGSRFSEEQIIGILPEAEAGAKTYRDRAVDLRDIGLAYTHAVRAEDNKKLNIVMLKTDDTGRSDFSAYSRGSASKI